MNPRHEPLDPQERELARRLAADTDAEPSAIVDARILAAARASLDAPETHAPPTGAPARTAGRRPRRGRWPMALGLAASVTLAVGVAWQLREPPLPAPASAPVASSDAGELEAMASAESPDDAVGSAQTAADTAALPPPPPPPPPPAPPAETAEHRAAVAAASERAAGRQAAADTQAQAQQAAEAARDDERRAATAAAAQRSSQRQQKAERQAQAMAEADSVHAPAAASAPAPVDALADAPVDAPAAAPPVAAAAPPPPSPAAPAQPPPASPPRTARAAEVTSAPASAVAEPIAAPAADASARTRPAEPAQTGAMRARQAEPGFVPDPAVAGAAEAGDLSSATTAQVIDDDARLPAAAWLQRIRERHQRGETELARASLARFVRAHPQHAVPADLRPLLR